MPKAAQYRAFLQGLPPFLRLLVSIEGAYEMCGRRLSGWSQALEGVPSPALSRPPTLWSAKATHMGWPLDLQATFTHHSISCSPADSPQAALILASESVQDDESSGTPSSLTPIYAEPREVSRSTIRKTMASHHQAMPQRHNGRFLSWMWIPWGLPFQKKKRNSWGRREVTSIKMPEMNMDQIILYANTCK